MMELLDRYLAAVRRNLPADEAADITEELRDVLLARAEEREAASGDANWPLLLKEFGHPLVVAARYRKHQWLIGPELYPFYTHFMKVVALLVFAVTVVVATFKAAFGGGDIGAFVAGLLGSLWWAAVASVGSVTILFALIERYGGAERHLRHWNPNQLPDVAAKQPGPWESAFEVGLSVLFLLWWVDLIRLPDFAGSSFRMEPAPIWSMLFWPILALAAARLAYNVLVWLRPRWRLSRALLGAATAVGGILILIALYRAGHWVTVVPTGIDADSAAGLQASLHLAFRIAIVAVGVIWAIGIVGTVAVRPEPPRVKSEVVIGLKALAVYAASIVSSTLVLGGLGISPGPHPAQGLLPGAAALLIVHALTVAAMLLVVAFATVRGSRLALLIFVVLFGTQTAMMQIETLAFNRSVGMPLRDVIVVILAGAANAAAVAAAASLLFRGQSGGAMPPPPHLGWRLAAASLAYVACYYGAGQFIAWSYAAVREYYGQGEGIDQRFLLPFQMFRGLLWSLIALFLAVRLKGSLLQRVAILTLLFPMLTAPLLLYPNSYMPVAVAKAHLIEIAVSEAIWGAIAALLLLPWRLEVTPAGSAPA